MLGEGPARSSEICSALGVSQPSVSRLLKRHSAEVLAIGRARARVYARRRSIPGLGASLPVYQVGESGTTRRAATLHAIYEEGFYVESLVDEIRAQVYDYEALPYFLRELRPSGYLGRKLSRRHQDLGLPELVDDWSANHCLRYLARYGWDLPGDLIIGDQALELYLAGSKVSSEGISLAQRSERYLLLARGALREGRGGSSAGGEQPKFLAHVGPEAKAVLVKFSPPLEGRAARRTADLLVVEHLAHETLRRHGHPASRSALVVTPERLFLEVERFDRFPGGGRRGVLAYRALNAEFYGVAGSWGDSALALGSQGQISPEVTREILWLEQFGRLIANNDMHHGNLSFFVKGETLLGLTPVFDMTAMFYAPQGGNLPEGVYEPPTPIPMHSEVWRSAYEAAHDLWVAVGNHEAVSEAFQEIAAATLERLEVWRQVAERLPT